MNSRVLMVCGEPVGGRMAGPGIRAVELGAALARAGFEVTVAAPAADDGGPLPEGLRRVGLTNASLREELRRHDCVVVGGSLLSRLPSLVKANIPLAVDLYTPVPLEAAALFRDEPVSVGRATLDEAAAAVRLEVTRADLILCANDRQRDLWVGALLAAGRLSPELYEADPSLEGLVRVVPFGVSSGRPTADGSLRARLAGAAEKDPVVLWAGGMHEWLDPEMVVVAAGRAAETLPGLRLVFMGSSAPNRALKVHGVGARARELAGSLGLLDRSVYFLDGWVPYAERGGYLADCDLGVCAHSDTAETRYSWRTRLLDYLWASLPVACTGGDALGDLMGERGAASLVRFGDADGLAVAMVELLQPGVRRREAIAAAATMAEEFRWDRVAEPLVQWAQNPSRSHRGAVVRSPRTALWRMYWAKGWHVLRTEGMEGIRRRRSRFADRD